MDFIILGTLASIFQRYVLNRFADKEVRAVVAFLSVFLLVLVYNFFTEFDFFGDLIEKMGVAYLSSQAVFNVFFKNK